MQWHVRSSLISCRHSRVCLVFSFGMEWIGLPEWYRKAVALLYYNITHVFHYAGSIFDGVRSLEGIKQGCPCSGSIFALASHGFLKALGGIKEAFSQCFAHDTASLITNLMTSLKPMYDIMVTSEKVANLKLNPPKCVVLVHNKQHHSAIWSVFPILVPQWAKFVFTFQAKYLGVWYGQDAANMSWQKPVQKFQRRAHVIHSLGLSFTQHVAAINIYCTSFSGYVLQFFCMPESVQKIISKTIMESFSWPRGALSFDNVFRFKDFELKMEFIDLQRWA